MSLSQKDVLSAKYYGDNITLLLVRNAALKAAPHIFSHTTLRIEAAVCSYDIEEDESSYVTNGASGNRNYYYEPHFVDQAVKVSWSFNEVGCTTTSCFPTYPPSKFCNKESQPFSFGLIDGKHFDACQPACFHSKMDSRHNNHNKFTTTLSKTTADDTEHKVPPYTIWYENSCILDDYSFTSLLIDPSKHHVDYPGVDTFDIVVTQIGADNIPMTSARINPQYCKAFYTDFVKDYSSDNVNDKTCGYDGVLYYVQILTGTSLIKLYRMTARDYNKAVDSFIQRLPTTDGASQLSFLQHHPSTKPYLVSVESWLKQIDKTKQTVPCDITLSSLGLDDASKRDKLLWTDCFSHIDDGRNDIFGGRLIEKERSILIEQNIFKQQQQQRRTARDTKSPKRQKELAKQIKNGILIPTSNRIRRNVQEKKVVSEKDLVESIRGFFVGLGQMLTDKENVYYNFPTSFATDGLLKMMQIYLNKLGPQVLRTFMASEVVQGIKAIGMKLFSTVISHTMITFIIERILIKIGSLAIALAGVASSALTVVGWILIIGPLVDLFFKFCWDPLKLATDTYSDSILRKLSEAVLLGRQMRYGRRKIEMTPVMFWALHLENSEDEEMLASRFARVLAYFSHRTVTSDGSAIDWSSHGDIKLSTNGNDDGDGTDNDSDIAFNYINLETAFRQLIVKNMLMTIYDNAQDYENMMNVRCKNVDSLYTKIILFLVCMVFIVPRVWVLLILSLCMTITISHTAFAKVYRQNFNADR